MVAEETETNRTPVHAPRSSRASASSASSRRTGGRALRPWSVAAATVTVTCFSEMEADRTGLRSRREGTARARGGSLALGSDASSSAIGSSRGATASSGFRGFASAVGLSAWLPSWMGRSRTAIPRHAEPASALDSCPPPVLYTQRWVQLAFLAMLALLSDLVSGCSAFFQPCFSVAATPGTWTKVFGQDPASLIDIFLFTNVFACFIEPFVIRNFGLRTPIVGAAMLMAVGCWLRSGIPFLGDGLPGYSTVVLGTMLVAVAQPFFQCTPPLLSATWFAPDERALSTAVAINFNQVGIATAFLAGGAFGGSESGLKDYFVIITIASTVVAAASLLFFQEKPPTPPSASELEKLLAEKEGGALKQETDGAVEVKQQGPGDTFLVEAKKLLATPGFIPPLLAFVTSIAVTNVVGAFMDLKLQRAGFSDQMEVDLAGAGFEVAIVIGGIILGGLVDRNKQYKSVTLWCLAATLAGVLALGMESLPRSAALVALLAIGSFAGPVQPINAELAVEVTYPCDENAIEAVQQLCGNLVSALLVPICEWAADNKVTIPGMDGYLRGDTILLLAILIVVAIYFSTFEAPLKRTEVDQGNCITDDGEMPVLRPKAESK